MPELTLEEAEARLKEHGGYAWLLSGRSIWSVSEVVAELKEAGLKVSNDAVARWFNTLPHTQDFGGPVGLRASRRDLIILFGSQMRSKEEHNERVG